MNPNKGLVILAYLLDIVRECIKVVKLGVYKSSNITLTIFLE